MAELEASQALEDALARAASERELRAEITGLKSEVKSASRTEDKTGGVRPMRDVDGL